MDKSQEAKSQRTEEMLQRSVCTLFHTLPSEELEKAQGEAGISGTEKRKRHASLTFVGVES